MKNSELSITGNFSKIKKNICLSSVEALGTNDQ